MSAPATAPSNSFPPNAHARLVRAVAREESPSSAALFAIALDGRLKISYRDWLAVLADLDASTLTIAEWLQAREDWV